jgi:formimidoylglutamate deiminase
MRYLLPDCLYTAKGFSTGLGVAVDEQGCVFEIASQAPPSAEVVRLEGCALMPGFINSHSHVFQRILRARCERASRNESFWSWRKNMYRLVDALTPEDVEVAAAYTFAEMLHCGYTSVKEFHYLHHPSGGGKYANPHEMALRIQQAASTASIALTLLRVGYLNVTEDSQKRFADDSLDDLLLQCTSLREEMEVPVGIAPHSIRAMTPEGFAACARWAEAHNAECHAHVAEQPREIEWTKKRYGKSPMQLLADHGVLSPAFTAVHATHLDAAEILVAGRHRITACICPSTEANLGDGIALTKDLLNAGVRLAIGSDSQAEIDPFQELRLLEYNERNRLGQRQVLDPVELINATTESMAKGATARLLAINLEHPSLVGIESENLASALVMAGRPECVQRVWLGTDWIETKRPLQPYLKLCERLS